MFNRVSEKSFCSKLAIVIRNEASNLYPRSIDLDSSVDSDNRSNSSNLPRSINMYPRLECAVA